MSGMTKANSLTLLCLELNDQQGIYEFFGPFKVGLLMWEETEGVGQDWE